MPGDEYYRAVSADVDKLIWLMSANKVAKGSRRNRDAFREYMRSWPFTDASLADLRALATGYEGTELADNFRFLAAMAEEKDIDRAMALRPLAEEVNDAAIAANYQLGRLAMKLGHTPAWRVMKLKTAREYFNVVEGAVKNAYQPMAGEHLKWLQRR
jgi:lipopolysaccharide biosynthesis regulator YciM